MKLLGYNGDAERTILGVGIFNKGSELPVDDDIAAAFADEASRAHGWTVRDIPPVKPATEKGNKQKQPLEDKP